MNVSDRIVYSKDEMLSTLNAALEKMDVFRYDPQYRRNLGDGFVEKFSEHASDIKKRKDDPFTVVVVGEFKRGKSSLINALLEEEVVTVDITPETLTLNRISYGAHDNEMLLSGSRRLRLADDELYRDKLETVIEKLNEPVNQLELHRPNELLKKIVIIDTPGLNDEVTENYSELVKISLLQADAIVYVFNVLYPISQTEQFFLRSAVLPRQNVGLFIVGNHADDISNAGDAERIKQTIQSRLQKLLPNVQIYMVSALDELCRVLNTSRPNAKMTGVLESEFQRLRGDIRRLVDEKSESVVVDRMQRLTTEMLVDLRAELDSIDKGLNMSQEEAAQALTKMHEERDQEIQSREQLREDMIQQIDSMKKETKTWMLELLQRIIDETQYLDSATADDLRKYYECYCVDLLQNGLKTCVELHQEQLYDILDGVASSLTEKFAGNPIHANCQFRFKLDNRIWTRGDSVGLAVSFLNGTSLFSTIGSLAIDGITGYLRETEIDKRKPELLNQIKVKLPMLSRSIDQTVEGIYRDLSNNLVKLIAEYFQEESDKHERLIKQAVQMSEKDTANKRRIADTVQSAREILKSVQSAALIMDDNSGGFN